MILELVMLVLGLLVLLSEMRLLRIGVEWCDRIALRDVRRRTRRTLILMALVIAINLMVGVYDVTHATRSGLNIALMVAADAVFAMALIMEVITLRRIKVRAAALELEGTR